MPANTPIELSLGDTDSKRLCPALTNSSPSPLEINGGRRSNCTVISAKKEREKGQKMNSTPQELRSLWTGEELSRSRHGQRLNGPRGIELPRVISLPMSADHFRPGCLGPTFTSLHPAPHPGQQMSSGELFSKIHIQWPSIGLKLWVWLH